MTSITEVTQKARLDVDMALDAMYPIIHIVTDDYGKVEEIMDRSYFLRNCWEKSANTHTKGVPSREYIRLTPDMKESDLLHLNMGAQVPQVLLDDLADIQNVADKLLNLCQDELSVASAPEEILKEIVKKAESVREEARRIYANNAKKVVFYARGDSSRGDGSFSERTAGLLEHYVELKARAMKQHPRKGKEIPEEWPDSCMVLYGCDTVVPRSIEQYVCRIEIMPLSEQDFAQILSGFGVINSDVVKRYTDWLAGFSESEVFSVLREIEACGDKGAVRSFNTWAKEIIEKKKCERIKKHGKLEYISVPDKMKLPDNMKVIGKWLDKHKDSIRDSSTKDSDEITKGMLLVGIPGTGKTLAAKCVSAELNLPLYQLQMSSVLGQYVGESDKNMAEVLEDVEKAAPCVVWVDEIEKALAGSNGSDGSGVMQRLFGQLLTFMQDMNKTVFIVATANDVSGFPPEFKRNGRFDVRFCMPMPDYRDCISIMQYKLGQFLGCDNDVKLAEELFQICCGMKQGDKGARRFLTGADINAVVKELKVELGGRRYNRSLSEVERRQICEKMENVVKSVSMTGETRHLQTICDIAKCYRGMLEMSATMACSSESLFSAQSYRPQRITHGDHEGDGACVSCMDRAKNHHKAPVYDQWLFDAVTAQLDLLLAQELKQNDYDQYKLYMKKYRAAHKDFLG